MTQILRSALSDFLSPVTNKVFCDPVSASTHVSSVVFTAENSDATNNGNNNNTPPKNHLKTPIVILVVASNRGIMNVIGPRFNYKIATWQSWLSPTDYHILSNDLPPRASSFIQNKSHPIEAKERSSEKKNYELGVSGSSNFLSREFTRPLLFSYIDNRILNIFSRFSDAFCYTTKLSLLSPKAIPNHILDGVNKSKTVHLKVLTLLQEQAFAIERCADNLRSLTFRSLGLLQDRSMAVSPTFYSCLCRDENQRSISDESLQMNQLPLEVDLKFTCHSTLRKLLSQTVRQKCRFLESLTISDLRVALPRYMGIRRDSSSNQQQQQQQQQKYEDEKFARHIFSVAKKFLTCEDTCLCNKDHTPNKVIQHHPSLQKLDLHKITICFHLLQDTLSSSAMPKPSDLNFQDCDLSSFTRLEQLLFRNCTIADVPNTLINNQINGLPEVQNSIPHNFLPPNLVLLDLSSNDLHFIDFVAFPPSLKASLAILNVSSNSLRMKDFDFDVFSGFSHLRILNLGHNPTLHFPVNPHFGALPNCLEQLLCTSNCFARETSFSSTSSSSRHFDLSTLPRSLQKLHLSRLFLPDENVELDMRNLPPFLSELDLSGTENFKWCREISDMLSLAEKYDHQGPIIQLPDSLNFLSIRQNKFHGSLKSLFFADETWCNEKSSLELFSSSGNEFSGPIFPMPRLLKKVNFYETKASANDARDAAGGGLDCSKLPRYTDYINLGHCNLQGPLKNLHLLPESCEVFGIEANQLCSDNSSGNTTTIIMNDDCDVGRSEGIPLLDLTVLPKSLLQLSFDGNKTMTARLFFGGGTNPSAATMPLLDRLLLQNCDFRGEIDFTTLPKTLTHLRLDGNIHLTGKLTIETIAHMSELSKLNVANCDFYGEIDVDDLNEVSQLLTVTVKETGKQETRSDDNHRGWATDSSGDPHDDDEAQSKTFLVSDGTFQFQGGNTKLNVFKKPMLKNDWCV